MSSQPKPPVPVAERATIRGAIHRDAGGIRDLIEELGYPMTLDDVHARLRALEADRSTKILVADDAEAVVGLAVVHWFELVERPGPFARMTALVVARPFRGTGVGRRLVEACEGVARRAGCLGIEVTTSVRRGDAHRFYDDLGYATGSSRHYRKTFD